MGKRENRKKVEKETQVIEGGREEEERGDEAEKADRKAKEEEKKGRRTRGAGVLRGDCTGPADR